MNANPFPPKETNMSDAEPRKIDQSYIQELRQRADMAAEVTRPGDLERAILDEMLRLYDTVPRAEPIILVSEKTGQRFQVQPQVLAFGADGHFQGDANALIAILPVD